MTRRSYKKGDWLFVCDRSGEEHYASDGRMEWNGLFVYKDYYEERQPQDFVRGVKDKQSVPITRSKTEPVFITDPITWDDL